MPLSDWFPGWKIQPNSIPLDRIQGVVTLNKGTKPPGAGGSVDPVAPVMPPSALPSIDNYFEFNDPSGNPDPPTGGSGIALSDVCILKWDFGPLEALRTYEVYQGTTSNFVPDTVTFTNRAATTKATVISMPRPAGYFTAPYDVFYKVCAVNTRGERSTFITLGAFRFVEVTSQADVEAIIEAIKLETGWVGAAQLAADVATNQDILDAALAQAEYALAHSTIDLEGANVIGDLAATRISAGLLASNVVLSSHITTDQLDVGTARLGAAYIGDLTGEHIVSGTIAATVAYMGTVGTNQLVARGAKIGNSLVDTLDASKITTGTLGAGVALVDTAIVAALQAGTAKITDAMIETLDAAKVNFGTLSGVTINAVDITAATVTGTLSTGADDENRIELSGSDAARINIFSTPRGNMDTEGDIAFFDARRTGWLAELEIAATNTNPTDGSQQLASLLLSARDDKTDIELLADTTWIPSLVVNENLWIPGSNGLSQEVKLYFDTANGRLKAHKVSTNQTYTFKPGEWAS